LTYRRMNKKVEGIGWWAVLVAFVIATYYSVIVAWAISYSVFSFNLSWGDDTEGFLNNEYLELVDVPGQIGGLVPSVFIPLIIVWLIVLGVLFRGVKKGIEVANRIMIQTLVVVFIIIVLRAVTLDGGIEGLNAFFEAVFGEILNSSVWVADYGQLFFSMSFSFVIMILYFHFFIYKSFIYNY